MTRTVVPILSILVILFASDCAKQRPREKEMEALKLLGYADAFPAFGSGIDADCGTAQEVVKNEAETIVTNWLWRDHSGRYAEQPIVPELPDAASKLSQLAKQCSKLKLIIPTTNRPEITKIREILGAEDRVENAGLSIAGKETTLHHYGWIQFLVRENKVERLLLDFKNSGY